MYKYILILLCLFSPNISVIYAPMSARTFEVNIEDICSYQISNSDIMYVEPCEKNYLCDTILSQSGSTGTSVGICRKNLVAETPYGASCKADGDCESGLNLKCDNNICVLTENVNAIEVLDIDSSTSKHYYCPNKNLFALNTVASGSPLYICKKIEDDANMKGLCSLAGKEAYPDYMKVCGEIELDDDSNAVTKIKMDSIGSVSDGKFVKNLLACKSGFALNFYSDGNTDSGTNIYYLKCVQYNGIEYKKGGTCKIKYILDKKNYYYDVDKVDAALIGGSGSGNKLTFCNSFKFINAKLDLFNQYVNKVTQLGNECSNIKYYDEPFTCKNDELRKLYYFFNNIEEYMLYKNEDEITEFILQKVYPSYGVKYSKDDASKYLSNKFICLLILLLL